MKDKQLICERCRRIFKHQGALTFHVRIRHEGRQYPQLWKVGQSPLGGQLIVKGQHLSPATEFRKGEITGSNHPKWKGGRVKSKGGYTLLYKPGHHRITHGNYVYEHIIIWEEANKMTLPEGYVVHHINGVRDDNRPKNLLAVLRKGHSPSLTVKEVQKRLREVEAQLAQYRLL